MSRILKTYQNVQRACPNMPREAHLFFNRLLESDLEKRVESRFTSTFIIRLVDVLANGADIEALLEAINNLELGVVDKMKPPKKFQHEPLKGLWHAHYQEVGLPSMCRNIKNQIKSDKKFKSEFHKILNDQDLSLSKKIDHLAEFSSSTQYKTRVANNLLTGEWIIYHIHNGKNYYLNVCSHSDSDVEIAEEIKEVSLFEFPFFKGSLPIFM